MWTSQSFSLSLSLVLAMLAPADALLLKSQMDSNSEYSYSNINLAIKEAEARCAERDFVGAERVIGGYRAPIGHKMAKDLLRKCFSGVNGKCLLSKSACAWTRKCISQDAPCDRPPIAKVFREIPAGTAALHELRRETKSLEERDQSVWVEDPGMDYVEKAAHHAAKAAIERMVPEDVKMNLWKAATSRTEFNKLLPEAKLRNKVYELASLGLWFLLACGTEYEVDHSVISTITGKSQLITWHIDTENPRDIGINLMHSMQAGFGGHEWKC